MVQRIKGFPKASAREKGAVMVIMAAAMVTLLGVTAIVVDVANFHQTKRHAQATVDASVLAGALDIGDYSDAAGFVIEYAERNMDVPAGTWSSCFDAEKDTTVFTEEQTYDCISISADGTQLRVKLPTQTTATGFASLFGFDEWSINVDATAEVVTGSQGSGDPVWTDPLDIAATDYDIRQGYPGAGFPQCENLDDVYWQPSVAGPVAFGTVDDTLGSRQIRWTPGDISGERGIAPANPFAAKAKGDKGDTTTTTTTDPNAPTTTTDPNAPDPVEPAGVAEKWVEAIFVYEHTDGSVTVLCGSSAENVDNGGASNVAVIWGIGGTDPTVRTVGESQKPIDLDLAKDKNAVNYPQNGMLMHISCSESWKNATQDPTDYPPENGWANPKKGKPIMPDPLGVWEEIPNDDAIYHAGGGYVSEGDAEWKVVRAIMVKMVLLDDGRVITDSQYQYEKKAYKDFTDGTDNAVRERNSCPGQADDRYEPAEPTNAPYVEPYIRLSD